MRLREALARPPADRQCRACAHFADDREAVERELPGLLTLSSAFGDSWGDAGLCRVHSVMLLPFNTCEAFASRAVTTGTPSPPAG